LRKNASPLVIPKPGLSRDNAALRMTTLWGFSNYTTT
jgi:hypothetical protein